MPIDINNVTLTGGTTLTATDSSNNKLFFQDSSGRVMKPQTAGGATLLPLFNVGFNAVGWTNLPLGGYVVPMNYTGGSGYQNVGSCYNTGNYRFTAPWTGLYLFKAHIYSYYPDAGISWYYHPLFLVNGSASLRRPGGGVPYRIRNYGMPGSYGTDSDCCEMIYCTAGDYVEFYVSVGNGMQGYGPYSAWSGAYLGN